MDISRDDAAQALSDITSTQNRSHALAAYNIAGPILILWGVIWLLGYTAMGLLPPERWGLVWAPADVIGIIATLVFSSRVGKKGGIKGMSWRVIGGMVLVMVFCSALFAMVHPSDLNIYLAFPGLLTGTIYTALGLWRMTRYLWIGVAVIAASMVGFFAFPAILPYWMAVTGGGGLILAGLLFRRA